ncbi:MAG: substrate-binding periplasmic protein, partial [Prochlorothrix sp.]
PSTVQSQPGASPRSSSAPSGTADRIAQATTDLPDDPLPDADTVTVPNLELYPPDIQRLMTQGYITVGIPNFDTPPLYFEKDGTLQGADVDLARNLGAQLELEVKFDREATTLNELIDRAARNQVDIAIGKLSTTVPRLKKLHASPNYIRFKQALLIDRTKLLELGGKDAESIQSILKTRPVDIGVIGKSSYERFAKRNFPNANVIGFPSWSDATEALAQGEVFAIYRDENEIKKIIMSRPQLAIRLKSVLFNDLEDSKSVYVSLQNPQLAHVIDNIIDGDPSNVWTSDRLIDEFYDLYTNPNFASN